MSQAPDTPTPSIVKLLYHDQHREGLSADANKTLNTIGEEDGYWNHVRIVLRRLVSDEFKKSRSSLDELPETDANQIKLWCEQAVANGYTIEVELISSLLAISKLGDISDNFTAILGKLYDKNGIRIQGVLAFQELLKQKPDSQEAAYQLALSLYIAGRSDEGIETLWPQVISRPNARNQQLFGLMLRTVGAYDDAISFLQRALELCQDDATTRYQLLDLYVSCDMHREAIELIESCDPEKRTIQDVLIEALLYRSMGALERSLELGDQAIERYPDEIDTFWFQIFNCSISSAKQTKNILQLTKRFWTANDLKEYSRFQVKRPSAKENRKIKIGFLSADFGDHVVSCFLAPLLRDYDQSRYDISLLSIRRRYDLRSEILAASIDQAISLEGMALEQATNSIASLGLDVIIETGGFTSNGGIQCIAKRCAPIQCHYIGYHATTGLDTIDYFIGDPILTPPEFADQFSEQIATLPSPWISHDSKISFPDAQPKIEVDQPVFGSFSQASKLGSETLAFWTAAMAVCNDAILIIKGKGSSSPLVQQRLQDHFETADIDPSRIIFVGAVPTQHEHLDFYNRIDIALDTTPWSGATTAFEALGMGVPLIGIRGDTTSGRMSCSVLTAAAMQECIADTPEQFAAIARRLASQFRTIRAQKANMQQRIRASILFDDERIRHDFYGLIDQLVANEKTISPLP